MKTTTKGKRVNLTERMIKSPDAPPAGSPDRFAWDARVPGLGTRVSSRGSGAFVLRYFLGGKDRRRTLGTFDEMEARGKANEPPRTALEQARIEAGEKTNAIARGVDPYVTPTAPTPAERGERTIEEWAGQWLAWCDERAARAERAMSRATAYNYRRCMARDVLPAFGDRRPADVTAFDAQELFDRKAGKAAANQILSTLSSFYNWLAKREAVENPARKIDRHPMPKRGAVAAVRLSPEQSARLLAALEELRAVDPIAAGALLVAFWTGRRIQEVLSMKRERIDLEAQAVDLGRTKGRSAGDVVWLRPEAVEALRAVPEIKGNPWVFWGKSKAGRRTDVDDRWKQAKRAAGLESICEDLAGFHIHDLRHNRLTNDLADGMPAHLVAQQAGHTGLDQLKVYSHLGFQDVRKWAEAHRKPAPEPAPRLRLVAGGAR